MWQTCTPPRQKTFGPNNPEPLEPRGQIPHPLLPYFGQNKRKKNQKALNYYYSSTSPQIFRPSYGLATHVGAVPLQCRCCTLLYNWMKKIMESHFIFSHGPKAVQLWKLAAAMCAFFLLTYQDLPKLALSGFGQSGHGLLGCCWSNLDLRKISFPEEQG